MSAITTVAYHLQQLGILYRHLDDETIGVEQHGLFTSYRVIFEEHSSCLRVQASGFLTVPSERRTEVMELTNLLNWRYLAIGAFHLSGKQTVAFECAVPLVDDALSGAMVRMLLAVMTSADALYPMFAAVCYGGRTVDEAVEMGMQVHATRMQQLGGAPTGDADTASDDDEDESPPDLNLAV